MANAGLLWLAVSQAASVTTSGSLSSGVGASALAISAGSAPGSPVVAEPQPPHLFLSQTPRLGHQGAVGQQVDVGKRPLRAFPGQLSGG